MEESNCVEIWGGCLGVVSKKSPQGIGYLVFGLSFLVLGMSNVCVARGVL